MPRCISDFALILGITRKRIRKDFIAFVKESGITEKDLSGSAIWKAQSDGLGLLDQLGLWIIRDWRGIKMAKEDATKVPIADFLREGVAGCDQIASISKVAPHMCLKYVDRYHPESLEKLTEKKN